MKSLLRQQNDQPQQSRFKDAIGDTPPSLSENPPVLTQSVAQSLPSAGSAESTLPATDSTPTQSQSMSNASNPEMELLAQILRTTVENLEAAGMCWRTKTKDNQHLRIVLPLDKWTVGMELKHE